MIPLSPLRLDIDLAEPLKVWDLMALYSRVMISCRLDLSDQMGFPTTTSC